MGAGHSSLPGAEGGPLLHDTGQLADHQSRECRAQGGGHPRDLRTVPLRARTGDHAPANEPRVRAGRSLRRPRLVRPPGTGQAVEWIIGRDLLAAGSAEPAGEGDVRIWPARTTACQAVRIRLGSLTGTALSEAPPRRSRHFCGPRRRWSPPAPSPGTWTRTPRWPICSPRDEPTAHPRCPVRTARSMRAPLVVTPAA
ncbi:SsgA family sporulation/cell division regulator [Streptomyces sp. NPDC090023]|uniref:SsgA family sporulation/cell division regulator n=1 Tax=unclassified Streptomyces TaxID=2593676 RepID=UPI00380F8F6F